ncbi:hypothetical protein CIB48_g3691 [Xylaria polymorpha]|nr:hypothetical protein CIB48_g3691 [Xylaria polymorpha]
MIGNNTPPAGTVEADLSNRGGEALAMAEADVLECEGIAGLIKALRASGQDIQFEGGTVQQGASRLQPRHWLEPLLVLVSLGHFVESLLVDDQIVVPRNLDISRILGPLYG